MFIMYKEVISFSYVYDVCRYITRSLLQYQPGMYHTFMLYYFPDLWFEWFRSPLFVRVPGTTTLAGLTPQSVP